MIFERAARREFAQAAAGISVALLAILTSTQLIRLLKEAAGGVVAPEGVLSLLGFSALRLLSPVLALTLFVSVLLVLSRMYLDSEMAVWLSSGLPLTAWVRPVMRFAAPLLLAIALLSAYLSPWAHQATADYRQQLAARSELSYVSPGTFKETSRGRRVFFVEDIADDSSRVGNVFVATMDEGRLGVVVSDTGRQEVAANGDRFVVLEAGRRYDVVAGTPAFRVTTFDSYRLRTEDGRAEPAERSNKRLPFDELARVDSNGARGELLWRIGMPVSAAILALLAIPLSYVNPRAGRSANMLIAILLYAVYNNLLSISQAWVEQGKLSFWIGVWAAHALMLLPLLVLFRRRLAGHLLWKRGR